jgi:ABC-type polysaccharide/polyol phosphate export permease
VALRRVPAPVWVFPAAATGAAVVNLATMTLALIAIELGTGVALPLSVLGLPMLLVQLALAAAGVGVAVGALAAVFADAMETVRVALTLAGFVTPVFYPLDIVPAHLRIVIEINPLYPFLVLFRHMAYGGSIGPGWAVAACPAIAIALASIGAFTFDRVRRALPATL